MKLATFYHHLREAAKQQARPLKDLLQEVGTWGIEAVEIDRDDCGQVEELQDLLQQAALNVSSIYGFYDFQASEETAKVEQHLRLAKTLGAQRIMVIPGFYAEAPTKAEAEQMLQGTEQLIALATKVGVEVFIEDFDHLSSPLVSLEGVQQYLKRCPQLKMTFDTGNFELAHQDLQQAYEQLRSRIGHVHLKDRQRDDNEQLYSVTLGDGYIPLAQLVTQLKADGYKGYLVIEHFGVDDYYESLKQSVSFVKAAMDKE